MEVEVEGGDDDAFALAWFLDCPWHSDGVLSNLSGIAWMPFLEHSISMSRR